jgi:aspartate aminotransferase
VKDAAIRALREGKTKYTDAGGIPELKAAICAKLKRDNGLTYTSTDVIASVGAKHTLYNICAVLVDPGDEVIVPAPYWVSYTEQVRLCEGVPVVVPTDEPRGFQLDLTALRRAVTPRASSSKQPNNPVAPPTPGPISNGSPSPGGARPWSPTSATTRCPTRVGCRASPSWARRSRRAPSSSTPARRHTR